MRVYKVLTIAHGLTLLFGVSIPWSINAETIDVDVHGLTCAFCVDSLQRQLKRLPDVEQVKVSLKYKKVRIVSSAEKIDIALIKETIVNSGFTPSTVKQVQNE